MDYNYLFANLQNCVIYNEYIEHTDEPINREPIN